jgi:hypothetical protein
MRKNKYPFIEQGFRKNLNRKNTIPKSRYI